MESPYGAEEKLMMAQVLADQYQRADGLVDDIIDASEHYVEGGTGGSE